MDRPAGYGTPAYNAARAGDRSSERVRLMRACGHRVGLSEGIPGFACGATVKIARALPNIDVHNDAICGILHRTQFFVTVVMLLLFGAS
jgi:hypothetical protein